MTISNVFVFEKETKNTVRYVRQTELGATETQYVPKSELPTPYPQQITITISWDNS